MSTSTITGIVKDSTGTAIVGVPVIARLRPGGFRTSDYAEMVDVSTTTNGSGAYSLAIERNADITPTGTWYEIEEQVPAANGGPRTWAVNADASGTLFARLLASPPAASSSTYLTTTLGDARYAFPFVAADKIVYVSSSGSDSNDGMSPGKAKLTLQAAVNSIAVNGDALIIMGAGTFAGATITDRRIRVQGVGLGTRLGALVYNATTISVVNSGLRDLQVVGTGSGTGVTWNVTASNEWTFVGWDNVLVNSWAKCVDVTSTAFDGVFTNVALEFSTTGGTLRGRVCMVKPWFESVTTALDVRGNTFVDLYHPKFSGGVTTKIASTGENGFTPQVTQVSSEQGAHNFPTNLAVGSAKPDITNQFADGVGLLAIANATTAPTSAPVGGGFWWVESGVVKWRGAGGGGLYAVGASSRFGTGADGATGSYVGAGHFDDTHALVNAGGSGSNIALMLRPKGSSGASLQDAAGNDVVAVSSTSKLGFFATAPVVKPTGVAVSAAGVHAALVTLGLISA